MCAGDVCEFNVLPVHDVNEEEEIEAVQLKIAHAQEAPVGRQLTAEQSSRIHDTIDKVLRESEHTLEPGGAFETELAGEQLSPRDFNGESYYNGVDDTVCLNFAREAVKKSSPLDIFKIWETPTPLVFWPFCLVSFCLSLFVYAFLSLKSLFVSQPLTKGSYRVARQGQLNI